MKLIALPSSAALRLCTGEMFIVNAGETVNALFYQQPFP